MSETINLHCQEYFGVPANGALIDEAIVTGVELPGHSFLRGYHYQPHAAREVQIPLEWEPVKAENLAEYYERHLTVQNESAPGWNCHSFAAAIMGWEVAWDNDKRPFHMPYATRPTDPGELQDQQAYTIRPPWRPMYHSMIGLPNPAFNIGVHGFRQALRIASNSHTKLIYPGQIHRYVRPTPLANKLGLLLPAFGRNLPVGGHEHQAYNFRPGDAPQHIRTN
jgi:hypothetical protein